MIEQLESRTMLAWQPFATDPGESPATAADLGSLNGVAQYTDALSNSDRDDYFRFQVANSGNFNLSLTGLKNDADVELSTSSGARLATSDKSGKTPERISRFLNAGTYIVHVSGAATPYFMQLQADLNWGSISRGEERRNVGLVFSNDSSQAISRKKETWVLIHGWAAGGRPTGLSKLARAVDAVSKKDQVLLLDWSQAAETLNVFDAAMWAPAAAQFAADKLASWGIPSARINIIGHSLGGLVEDRLASDVKGGVNRLIALDPATDISGTSFSGVNFAGSSRYSLAFIASNWSTPASAATADEAFKVNIGPKDSLMTHLNVLDLFASMVTSASRKRPDRISKLFSITKLSNSKRPFKKDAFEGQYEGILDGKAKGNTFVPTRLTYMTKAGKRVALRA